MGPSFADQRQFGRRPSNISCNAVLPGHVIVPCTIVNLSEGGALLSFNGDVKPPATFRLAIDDTSFNLLCEVRHQAGNKAGVRFARLAEGIALNRHFQRIPAEPANVDVRFERLPRPTATPVITNRELRDIMLAILLAMTNARLLQEQLDAEVGEAHGKRPTAFAGRLVALAALTRQSGRLAAVG